MSTPTTTSSLISSSTSSSSSLSTSTTSTSSSTTSTTLGLPPSTTSESVTTTTATPLTDTTTSSSTTDSTSSNTTTNSSTTTTSTTSTSSTTPTTTSTSTSTGLATIGPTVITTTSLVAVTPSATLPPASGTAAPSTSKGFFENKGAVAGVFTVVGLIVLALFVVLIVTIIRRRRAKQFDREVEAAAAEAAAAPAPHFLDDDDDDPYRSQLGHPTTYNDHPAQYSDISSHGTYSQPPLGSQEAYSMRELGPGPGELYSNPYTTGGAAGAAGAAGVGVARARSTRDPGAFASGFQDGATPYPAFAGPAAFHSGAYGNGGGYDSLDTGVGPGVQRGMSLSHQNADYGAYDQQQQHSQGLHPGQYMQQSDLARNPSQATASHASSTLAGSPASPPLSPKDQPSYAAHYVNGPAQEAGEDAYGGYTDEAHGAGQKQEDRQSYYDDDEDEGRPRVLKVANE